VGSDKSLKGWKMGQLIDKTTVILVALLISGLAAAP
jgi:hypothetical protein